MKYLLKFNESSSKSTMTDRDFEIIENCFLEYVDNKQCTVRQGEWSYSLDHAIIITFPIPEQKNEHFVYRWLEKFLPGLYSDIKRCESYGYECRFNFTNTFAHDNRVDLTQFSIWVYKKGLKRARFKHSSFELTYGRAMHYIQKQIKATNP